MSRYLNGFMKNAQRAARRWFLTLAAVTVAVVVGQLPAAAAPELLATAPTDSITVNINEADAETLAANLVGIGLQKAEAIVLYREENGRFYLPEELAAVKGIGAATVSKNIARIVLE